MSHIGPSVNALYKEIAANFQPKKALMNMCKYIEALEDRLEKLESGATPITASGNTKTPKRTPRPGAVVANITTTPAVAGLMPASVTISTCGTTLDPNVVVNEGTVLAGATSAPTTAAASTTTGGKKNAAK